MPQGADAAAGFQTLDSGLWTLDSGAGAGLAGLDTAVDSAAIATNLNNPAHRSQLACAAGAAGWRDLTASDRIGSAPQAGSWLETA